MNGENPGNLGSGEQLEVTLDLTWSGAIARSSFIKPVISATTNTTDGADLSEAYIVDNNLGDVMTELWYLRSLHHKHTGANILYAS